MEGSLMEKKDWLANDFEETRPHLKAVAYRMLGSVDEAEDAVQEAWIRLTRSESNKIDNLGGWLTTVVARVCLDMLRSRKSRKEEPLDEKVIKDPGSGMPEADLLIADSVGPALLVVLDTLTPIERIAFVLHDLFDLSFEEIAPIIDRTETAARQLASRARRRVRGMKATSQEDTHRQREIVTAFLAASRDGNFSALLKLLHPDVVLRADKTAVKVAAANQAKGAPAFKSEIRGAKDVAETFKGRAAGAQLALLDGFVGATWAPSERPVVVFAFAVRDGKIEEIDVIMNTEDLKKMEVEVINE
jgi:RNA polymerase sigma factor (sigma-70 family)